MGVPMVTTWLLIPKLDYLPPVKRDAVDGFFQFPPGANTEVVETEIVAAWSNGSALHGGEKEPALKNYYILVWPGGGTIGARVKDQSRVKELEAIVRDEITAGLPDTKAFVYAGQPVRRLRRRAQHRHAAAVLGHGGADGSRPRWAWSLIAGEAARRQVQPWPGTELAEPELRLIPNDQRINEAGWTREHVADVVRSLGDGLWSASTSTAKSAWTSFCAPNAGPTPRSLQAVPLVTPPMACSTGRAGQDMSAPLVPARLMRIDRRRTVALNVTPPEGMSLEEAIDILRSDVAPELQRCCPRMAVFSTAAVRTPCKMRSCNMIENFLIGSHRAVPADERTVSFSERQPAGDAGLTAGHRWWGHRHPAVKPDHVSAAGSVDHDRVHHTDGPGGQQRHTAGAPDPLEPSGTACRDARPLIRPCRVRLRPIFMSTLTSIFGMLPLVLIAGAGSVIYRGLASVIVGGMMVSTVFTLLLLPMPAAPRRAGPCGLRHIAQIPSRRSSCAGPPDAPRRMELPCRQD